MMRILFLDDDAQRHSAFREWMAGRGLIATHVETVAGALSALRRGNFDVVFLDHDLGGRHWVPSEDPEGTGYTVAKEMAEGWRSDHPKPRVIVHSYNNAGAERMVKRLDSADFEVSWNPFGPGMLEGVL